MIKKLRRRFIWITMISVALVLFSIMGAINILNYRNVVRDADTILAILRDFDGSFPGLDGGFGPEGGAFGPGGDFVPDGSGGEGRVPEDMPPGEMMPADAFYEDSDSAYAASEEMNSIDAASEKTDSGDAASEKADSGDVASEKADSGDAVSKKTDSGDAASKSVSIARNDSSANTTINITSNTTDDSANDSANNTADNTSKDSADNTADNTANDSADNTADNTADDAENNTDWLSYQQRNGRGMKRGFGGVGGEFSAETPFESRYFSVQLDEDGKVFSTDMSRIAAIDEAEAESYAEKIFAQSKTSGFSGWYRFLKYTNTDGSTSILFLDCQRGLSNFRSFLLISVLVSLAGFAAVLLLVVLLSGRIVRPVQESYEKQKRFITDAGHELKTPLTIIDADVSVLEMDVGESEWIDDVRVQTKRLAGLTNDLIYLSRMDEENTQLEKIDFPLSDIAAETAQSFRGRAQIEGKTFSTEIEPEISYFGDEKSIRQLLNILLDNAVKYASDDGSITFRLQKKGKGVQLEVSNSTDGMDQDTLTHMFDRFYRADKSRNSGKGGYGIGLSIASAVVAVHKGKIIAESPDGKLMKITVTLP